MIDKMLEQYIKDHNNHVIEIRGLVHRLKIKWYVASRREDREAFRLETMDNSIAMIDFLQEHLKELRHTMEQIRKLL